MIGYTADVQVCSRARRPSASAHRDPQAVLPNSSTNQLFAIPLSQHRLHLAQAIDSGAHQRLIPDACSLGGSDLTPEIHHHLALLFCDDGLNDGHGLFEDDVGLP
jgi:hypothetical protein